MNLADENRLSWNQATKAKNLLKGDQVAFFRNGGSTLFPEDQKLIGDVFGRKLVHLLCNGGQDTLSLARLGAIATGVDISDEAISFAQKLSQETAIAATFYRAEVLEWLEKTKLENKRFDVVFCAYGVVRWISNLEQWMQGIAAILEPEGRFVCIDFHPTAMMFDTDWHHAYPYCSGGKITKFEKGVGSDVAVSSDGQGGTRPYSFVTGETNFSNPHSSYTFDWGIGEIVTALAKAGLRIVTLKEYFSTPWTTGFTGMREGPDGRMIPPAQVPSFPLLYGIVASKN